MRSVRLQIDDSIYNNIMFYTTPEKSNNIFKSLIPKNGKIRQ